MKDLNERDVHRALAVVAAAAAGGNGTAFGIETVDAIMAAIPADEAAYVEWCFGDRDSIRVARGGNEPPWLDEALAATCGSYPLRDVDHAASVEPLRISDVVSLTRFRKSRFYLSVMRPLGREHELKLWLPAPPGHARYFELERGPGRDFDGRDRAFLSLLRPHLARLRAQWECRPHVPPLTDRGTRRARPGCTGPDEPPDQQPALHFAGGCPNAPRAHLRQARRTDPRRRG